MIGILNLQLGNITSLAQAIYSLGYDYHIIDSSEKINDISHLIMPGVGHFGRAMHNAESINLLESINKYVLTGRPFMGICLGMQLLQTTSEEAVGALGFDFIPGAAIKFSARENLRVPHVGWNTVNFTKNHQLFENIENGKDFYFVHSYYCKPVEQNHIGAMSEYGVDFASIMIKNNIIGVQFHPEKSQKNGLQLLDNFCNWGGK